MEILKDASLSSPSGTQEETKHSLGPDIILVPEASQKSSADLKTIDTMAQVEEMKGLITLRVSVTGNVDSGKTTLTGVLSAPQGVSDDGRGALRDRVFNYAHEKENGRTTSIGHEIIGFDQNLQ